MNTAAPKTLVALVPACVLFLGSPVLFLQRKTVCSFLQLFGPDSGPTLPEPEGLKLIEARRRAALDRGETP
jgi:hypothetical protein